MQAGINIYEGIK